MATGNGVPEVERIRASLEVWLGGLWDESTLRVTSLEPFGSGHSGATHLATVQSARGSEEFVVRTSVPGVKLSGPNDVGRQGRVMAALWSEGAPVPRVHAIEPDAAIADRAVVVLERVVGDDWCTVADSEGHRAVGEAAVRGLQRLRETPSDLLTAILGTAESPTEELARWFGLLERSESESAGEAKRVFDRLVGDEPSNTPMGLVHGDFHYGNLLFRGGEVVAVLDWEIASHGPSLSDLGALAVASLRRRYGDPNPTGDVDIRLDELAALYGVDHDDAAWFIAAACVKYAAIIAYNLRLHRSGRKHDPIYEALVGTVPCLLDDASDIVEHGLSDL